MSFAAITAIGYACVVLLRQRIIGAYTPNPVVMAAALPLVTIVAFYHCVDAIQVTTAFVLRAYKVAVVPTVIYAVALWGIGVDGGYLLGFDVGGWVPAALTGARGFWSANFVSLLIAGAALVLYLHHISRHPLRDAG